MKVRICNYQLYSVLQTVAAVRKRLKERGADIPGLTLLKLMKAGENIYRYYGEYRRALEAAKEQYVLKDENGAWKVSEKENGMTEFQCKSDRAAQAMKTVLTEVNHIELQYLLDDEDLRHLPLLPDELDSIKPITSAGQTTHPAKQNEYEVTKNGRS